MVIASKCFHRVSSTRTLKKITKELFQIKNHHVQLAQVHFTLQRFETFCYAGFRADADEPQKMRQVIFRSSGRVFGSKAVEVRVVPSNGDCLFPALGLQLEACGVLVFDGVVDGLGQKVRAFVLALVGDLDQGGAHLVFECPLRLWFETSSGLEYCDYLR